MRESPGWNGEAMPKCRKRAGRKRQETGQVMWYVVWVKTGRENEIKQLCDRMLSGAGAYRECFIPKTETVRRVRGEQIKRETATFPGYLFFECGDADRLYHALEQVPEFTKLLGTDGAPQALYPHEEAFLRQMSDGERVIRMSRGYLVGDELVVTEGPLKDYKGRLAHIDRHKREAKLEVELLGGRRYVTVGLEVVAKLPAKKE